MTAVLSAAATKPAATSTAKPATTTAKPAEAAKPATTTAQPATATTTKPAEAAKPSTTTAKPAETAKPAATAKPAEENTAVSVLNSIYTPNRAPSEFAEPEKAESPILDQEESSVTANDCVTELKNLVAVLSAPS